MDAFYIHQITILVWVVDNVGIQSITAGQRREAMAKISQLCLVSLGE